VSRNPALDAEKIRIIKGQSAAIREGSFFLAGGTGLAVRLKHRTSRDLDWFTAKAFDADSLRRTLEAAPEKPTRIEQAEPHTLRAYYGEVETSFILYRQIQGTAEETTVSKSISVPLASLELLAGMKAAAVHDRGAKRDFLDIHAICLQPGWSVPRFIEHAARCLPLQPEQVARALTYFEDAEPQPMPGSSKYSWPEVKKALVAGVQLWERTRSREPDVER
jgi:hypothetical protein